MVFADLVRFQQLQFDPSNVSGFGSIGSCTLGFDGTDCPLGKVTMLFQK